MLAARREKRRRLRLFLGRLLVYSQPPFSVLRPPTPRTPPVEVAAPARRHLRTSPAQGSPRTKSPQASGSRINRAATSEKDPRLHRLRLTSPAPGIHRTRSQLTSAHPNHSAELPSPNRTLSRRPRPMSPARGSPPTNSPPTKRSANVAAPRRRGYGQQLARSTRTVRTAGRLA